MVRRTELPMFRANQYLGSRCKRARRLSALLERRLAVIHLAAILLALTLLMVTGCEKKVESTAQAPPDVDVAKVVQQDVPITKEWVATLAGFVNADIRAQVEGYLIRQNYPNGAFVRKGALLFQIDPRPFQAALDQAKANLEQTKGTLEQAKATLEEAKANQQRAEAALGKTEIDVTRYTPLAKESVISQQELDKIGRAHV